MSYVNRVAYAAVALSFGALPARMSAQQLATRVAILQAEDRRAPTAGDLATIRSGARSSDPQTARIAMRALGRLERPSLVPDILAGLRHRAPEVRAEAANAAAQAFQSERGANAGPASIGSVQSALIARLHVEAEPEVRAALCESIARLPYGAAADAARAETAIVEFAATATTNADRLGVAKGLEAFVRLQRDVERPREQTIEQLKAMVRSAASRPEADLLRDARVRRLALESLITIDAADAATISAVANDPDPQVRRLAVHAATMDGTEAVVAGGLTDPIPMVRIEALRTLRQRSAEGICRAALVATADADISVALLAIDELSACAGSSDAVTYLSRATSDLADAEEPRNWHRAAHALVALATAAPDRAREPLTSFSASRVWQLRMYAARAAGILGQRDLLERLTHDTQDNVVRAANVALGHERPAPDAPAALRSTASSSPGSSNRPPKPSPQPASPLNAADLRRLAAPRARFTIRDVGVFDVALFTMEAPATVLRFAQLATAGYYNGLTFDRVVPNGVIQGGSPGSDEHASHPPAIRDEVGLWPHVRGALGISTRGRDTGDAELFVDLVDNPRYDHTYTVFAQVLNGLDIVDRILEGDVIERVEILP